jgi:hypothetical protein
VVLLIRLELTTVCKVVLNTVLRDQKQLRNKTDK